ncbi:MAG: LuxR C-terminal-related transcriptional regulator [Propionibacteriales bacterium]|nr:LuxR C-terminal-related transcriptional regulator [Propionibacteriales bacterium]
MTLALGDMAALALSHDPAAALAQIEAHLDLEPDCPEVGALHAFALVLTCQFDAAAAWVPASDDVLAGAVAGFVAAVCQADVPCPGGTLEPGSPYAGLHAFVAVEAAMSAGQIARAEVLARAAEPELVDVDGGTYWAWNRVALARSLAFQGRFTEARETIEAALSDPRRSAWPAVDRIARGVRAFVAAHEGDAGPAGDFVLRLRAELPAPTTYLESAAFVLAAFAEQAAGRADGIDELVLHGGGGAYLPRYQIVDRVYVYEVLVESALVRGDSTAAQVWLERAEGLPTEAHDMAGAAVARCRARLALALDDPATGVRESELSGQRAALVGGSLEVFRSALLQAVASRAQGAPVDSEGLEQIVRLAASTGARVVREWAVRELSARGRRLRNVPGQGWDGLTDRQRLVAVLAAQGLRNREIGAQLFVSERTVEGHIAAVLDALGAPSRVGIGQRIPVESLVDSRAVDLLTPRQRGVAVLVAEGYSNAAIATTLGISEKTVEKHISDLFARLQVQSRAGVAALVRAG